MEVSVRKMGLMMGVAAVALLATACEMRFYMGLTVEEDGSGTMSFDLAANEELRGMAGDEFDIDMGEFIGEVLSVEPENVPCDVEPLLDGDFQGARMTCSFASWEQLMEMAIPVAEQDTFELPMPQSMSGFQLERDGDTFRFLLDATDINRSYDAPLSEMPMDMDMNLDWDSIYDIRFIVTLPGEVVSHNASVVEGNTLTWWFPTAEPWLMAESRVSGGLSPAALWSLIAVGVIILVMLILRFRPTGKTEPSPPEPGSESDAGAESETEEAADPETEETTTTEMSESEGVAEPDSGEEQRPTE